MGISPENAGDKNEMNDVVMARSYVRDIGGKGPVQSVLERTFSELSKRFPHDDDPQNKWTRRRVRGFWNLEASFVRFREMIELHKTADAAKAERELIEKARKEHAEFIAKTASIAALLERQDEDFFGEQIKAIRSENSRMDRS